MKLLIVEDEHRIAQALKEGLGQEGYAVDLAYDGEEGVRSALADDYDAIIMDGMLPLLDGVKAVKQIRAAENHTPILMLTARSQATDIIRGLDGGADDYLTKPFSFDVLLARLRALLRRPSDAIENKLTVRDLELDIVAKRVWRNGQEISLSGKEFAILEYLLRSKGRILSKNNIITHVWDFDADVMPNNVEVFITYLRSKIDKPFEGPPIIETVRGFGYVIKEDE